MRGRSIVILSSDDWGWKTSKYQLSVRFSRANRVLFVASIGFRAPTASRQDVSRIWAKLRACLRGPRQMRENVWVLTPIVIPFGSGRFIRWLNRRIFAVQYWAARRLLSIRDPYVFVFSPNWEPYVSSIRREKLVYYCVDEHSGFKGVNAEAFARWDDTLTREADHVFCSARALFDKKLPQNASSHYLPHGVNWQHFAKGEGDLEQADRVFLDRQRGPVLLFFGHISYDWVDTDLLRHIAEHRPNWNIVLVGRSSVSDDEFARQGNIHVIGEREYEQLPSVCKYADIGLIPFVDSGLTQACNPLKLYEYLAAGLPVVSTDIPEVRHYDDVVFIGRTPDEFLAACDEALAIDRHEYSPKVTRMVERHDWDSRVEEIYSVIST